MERRRRGDGARERQGGWEARTEAREETEPCKRGGGRIGAERAGRERARARPAFAVDDCDVVALPLCCRAAAPAPVPLLCRKTPQKPQV